jgi:tripartite-type tricarboxylate transporter receptor subunit TctC
VGKGSSWGRTVCAYGVIVMAAVLIDHSSARAQDAVQYPTRRINLVVGFAAGGFADTVARTIGQKLQERWGETVTVENRAGVAGNAAAKYVATSPPDGHTILVTTAALAINETLYKERDYKLEDLLAVAIPVASPEIIATHPSKPSGSLKEFLAWAKDREITYATAGVGSGSHIVTEYLFRELAKIRAVHVPYRGGAPAVQAAVGNQVDVIATSFGAAPQITDGKLNGLAVATAERWSAAPQVPTYIEGGFPDLVAESWVGFFVPAKTDSRIVQKLNAAINEIAFEPEVRKLLTGLGTNLSKRPVAETAQYVKAEVDKWGKMVRTIGVTAGN